MESLILKDRILPGTPYPLGASYSDGVCNFSIFCRHGQAVSLLLFTNPKDKDPKWRIHLDPERDKTEDIWHIAIKDIQPGQVYAYEVDGPYAPEEAKRFNKYRCLIDPYAKALTQGPWNKEKALAYELDEEDEDRDLSFNQECSHGFVPKSIVIDDSFDWEDSKYPRTPLSDSLIYEVHLKGATQHSSSEVEAPGTYKGLIDKIPYFKQLGVTAVELLPVQEFDEREYRGKNPRTKKTLSNYWGYSTLAFFAPKGSYASSHQRGEQVKEFKEMVKAFHQNGLEIILDVVFNHTSEGNHFGPTLSFKGIDNEIYYHLDLENPRFYRDYSGCGNSINANHPVVCDFIIDCLRYWVREMRVDGFRFDLASILARGPHGEVLSYPPVLERIAQDPLLRSTKIIAEAWDATGLYQVGHFPGGRFAEWNGKYRDNLRGFWRGDAGLTGELATRLTGSSDLYHHSGRKPYHSINFITSHDGFTLNDLVSYEKKHNLDNGEDNRDGDNHNLSSNYGVEGSTNDFEIKMVRLRQRKNLFTSLMISRGVPMILGGDEMGRSQGGNNNPWCQDNEISWMNWTQIKKDKDFYRYARKVIQFRKRHSVFKRGTFLEGTPPKGGEIADVEWFHHRGQPARWDGQAKSIAFHLSGQPQEADEQWDSDFYIIMNAHSRMIHFRLPSKFQKGDWKVVIDTGNPSPFDYFDEEQEKQVDSEKRIRLRERSLMILKSDSRLKKNYKPRMS